MADDISVRDNFSRGLVIILLENIIKEATTKAIHCHKLLPQVTSKVDKTPRVVIHAF